MIRLVVENSDSKIKTSHIWDFGDDGTVEDAKTKIVELASKDGYFEVGDVIKIKEVYYD